MNRTRTLWMARCLFLAVMAIVASAGLLCAQDYTCTFTLPGETRWGTATLPAGNYTMKIDTSKSPHWATVRGPSGTVQIPALAINDRYFAGNNMLILARQGGKRSVRFLHLGTPEFRGAGGGVVFSYPRPKDEPPLVASEPQLIERVPVLMAAK